MKRFWTAVAVAADDTATVSSTSPYPIGSWLARAAARVLGAHDAGITVLTAQTQVSLGASGDPAAEAERWQFTTGQGPSLAAQISQQPVMATLAVLTGRWPWFTAALLERTPYRSVYCLPLPFVGILDLYFTDPTGCLHVDTGAAEVIAEQTTHALDGQVSALTSSWPGSSCPAIRRRADVWTATGMLQKAMTVTPVDALDLLRARAYAENRPIEDIAADLLTGTLHGRHW